MRALRAVSDNKVAVPHLFKMLTYRRKHNSIGEKEFIKDFIMPLRPYIVQENNVPMAFFVYVDDHIAKKQANIMFTSHVDTVHAPTAATRQQVVLKDGLYQKNDNQPLGADDAAGVWLLLNMINAEVPGVYAFFRGEECGGIGSSYTAKHRHDLFDGIDCAIAFDRRGTGSIITHQGGDRGCSDEFARSLARTIGMGMTCDTTGLYTDTAEFFDIIDNCTNVSVGYQSEHSKNETLNHAFIHHLRDNLLKADWSALDHTPPKKETINPFAYGASEVIQTAREEGSIKLFKEIPAIGPTDIADFIFDNASVLPKTLQDMALDLAQKIYKRFE